MATSIEPRYYLRRGDDFEVFVDFFDSETGDPLNMTGWGGEGAMTFSNCPTVEMTFAWVAQASGQAKVSLTDEQTAGLHVGEYNLRVRGISPAGKRSSTLPKTVVVSD